VQLKKIKLSGQQSIDVKYLLLFIEMEMRAMSTSEKETASISHDVNVSGYTAGFILCQERNLKAEAFLLI